MSAFIWTIAAIMALEAVAKVVCLVTGNIPERAPAALGIDLILSVIMLCWAAAVLS